MTNQYNNPAGIAGSPQKASSTGEQIRTDYHHKKAIMDASKEQFFTPLSDVTNMPKHFGKTIKAEQFFPIIDDRNVNDQGIDAAGTVLEVGKWTAFNVAGLTLGTNYASQTDALAATGAVSAVANSGNLQGSSKDITVAMGKIPSLTENGGRRNRVGSTRKVIQADLAKLGIFMEYTKDSIQFDTNDDLYGIKSGELIKAASEISEQCLQMDLLKGGTTVRFAGDAVSLGTISGEAGAVTVIDYDDLQRLSIDLTNARTPKKTKILTGSRLVDTKVVNSGWVLYCGSEMRPTFSKMKDHHNNPAFISIEHYAANTTTFNGEIGKVGDFRIVEVPEMLNYSGQGAAVTTNGGYRASGNKYDVFPLMVVGAESFTTIGFQTDGKDTKFRIKHAPPESDIAYSKEDPFGEEGMTSIKWFYATLMKRPERIGLLYSVAEQ